MKTYHFEFNAQKAEFHSDRLGVAVAYGPGCNLASERHVMTWPEAQAYLVTFSATIRADHAALVRLVDRSDRAPAGYASRKSFVYGRAEVAA